jgi:two-component system LytT family response regulator
MKALIVDDERRARDEMKRLLAPYSWIRIVGEASSVRDALEGIEQHDPEVVFLDIQMHKQDGFQLIQALPSPMPKIIFTTAYDEFAVRAFEVNALDYLLKPIAPDRLKMALAKLQEPSRIRPPELPLRENDRVFMRDGAKCWFVLVNAIRMLESEGDYTRVYFDDQRVMIYRTISSLERIRQSNPPSGRDVFLMYCRDDGNRRGWRSEAAKPPRDQTTGEGIRNQWTAAERILSQA